MSKTISSLNVNVLGNISGLAKSFSGGVGLATNFARQIAGVGSKLAGLAGVGALVTGALAGVGTAIGGALAIKDQFQAIDATAKLSDRLGVTTESLVGFQHAAALAGVSGEELTGGFEKMFKTMGEAMNGTKNAVETFNALGLSAAVLQSESPDQAFKDIADRISHITNPAQRAAAAMDVFGKSGQSLLPLLTTGAAGIAEAQAEAQKLGLTFSRIDAAKVEAANDAVTRLKGAFTGIARTIAIALAPLVEGGATKLTGWIVAALPTIRYAIDTIGQFFGNLYSVVAPVMANIWGVISSVWNTVYSYVASIGGQIYDAVAPRWEAMVESVTANVMAWWDVLSAVGGAIVDIAEQAWEGVTTIWQAGVELVTGQTDQGGASVKATFGSILDSMNAFRDYCTDVFYAIEYSIKHWQDFFELAGTKVALVAVQTGNQIAYVFNEVIATYVGYGIAVVWAKISDFAANTATIFTNLGSNIVSVFKNLPGLIKGTAKWSDVWTPLTKGFEDTVIEWPGIADREKGEMEKQLESESEWLENNFAQGLADHITKRTNEAHDAAGNIVKGLKDIFNFKNQKVTAPTISPKINPNNLALSITPQIKAADALKVGSAEAQLLHYGGPKLAGLANGSIATAAPPSVPTASARPATAPNTVAGGTSKDDADFKSKFDRAFILWQKTEQNTRTPQLAVADI